MVGRQRCGLLHRSARTRRHEGNAEIFPRAFAATGATLEFWSCTDPGALMELAQSYPPFAPRGLRMSDRGVDPQSGVRSQR
jgi:hypothetical protein